MGGVWERQIRTIRNVLAGLSSESKERLTDESFSTLLQEVASVINSRPLTAFGEANDPEPLTPNHLLTMKVAPNLPPPGEFPVPDICSRKQWRRVQALSELFWNRWKREYLTNLQVRQKWTGKERNLKIGDIVMLKGENTLRNTWSLAKVMNVHKDCDNLVRRVTLKISDNGHSKTAERPIHKCVMLLPVEEQT